MRVLTSNHASRLAVLLVIAMVFSTVAPLCAADVKVAQQQIVISDITDRVGSINISAGKAEGIVAGAKGMVMRDGKKIADYQVMQVNWGFSRIALSNVAEGYTVRVGDSAPITGFDKPPSEPKKKPAWTKYIWTAVGVGALIYLLGRGGSSSGDAPPTDLAITLEAEKTTVFDDTDTSTVTITATVRDSKGDLVVDGTTVTFATTSGTLNRLQMETSRGKAVVTLTAPTTEPAATVTATAGKGTATLTVSFAASIELEANPTTIQTTNSGGAATQSTITATCRDAQGNPATTGEVTFATTLGTITDKVDIVNGVAEATFTSGQVGTANVSATWSGTTARTTVTVTAGPPSSITVTSSESMLLCDGNSSATITATVRDIAGNLASNGTVVKFSVITDAGGGGNGTITPQATTLDGVARATLVTRDSTGARSKSGVATVKVEVLIADQPTTIPAPLFDIENHSVQVQFISTTVGQIGLGANPRNIRGWDMNTEKSTITAVVKNTDNAPVPDGTVVTFTATHGMITGSATTTGGVATATLQADASGDSSWNGLVNVTATAGGVSATSTGLIVFSGWPSPSRCQANASPSTLPPTNGQATIQVQALDVNGNPIVDGTTITANTSRGTLTSTSATTTSGVAVFTLNTSTDTGNPTLTGPGTVTITIPSGGNNPETGGLPVTLTVDFTVS